MSEPELVLVGELNPYGPGEHFALYDRPENSAGARLRRIMGVDRETYLGFARYNLCERRWSARAAREAAGRVRAAHPARVPVVLLGRKVAAAFDAADLPPFTRSGRYVLLPHPSGRCREWNDPRAAGRARDLLARAAPGVPWGCGRAED